MSVIDGGQRKSTLSGNNGGKQNNCIELKQTQKS